MLKDLKCKPGSYIEIVPIGLHATLQYNSSGILQKIIVGFNHLNHKDEDVLDANLTIELKKRNIVPQRLNISKGTTWVKGVFYTSKKFKKEGRIPECLREEFIFDLDHNPNQYIFYAGDILNDSFRIAAGPLVNSRLTSFGFQPLPGFQVYDEVKSIPVAELMKSGPFEFPYISGLLISESSADYRFQPANLSQVIVTDTHDFIDSHGYIQTKIQVQSKDSVSPYYVIGDFIQPYSEVVRHDIQLRSVLVLDGDTVLAARTDNNMFKPKLSRNIHCLVCGKAITVPTQGHTMCADVHCVSRLYPEIDHFVTVLGLPKMTKMRFDELIKSKQLICLTDIFMLDEYKDTLTECTLSKLLSATVPVSAVRNKEIFEQFVNYLGSVEALDYYLQNPDCIVSDLHLERVAATSLASWLKDPANVLTVVTLLDIPQIQVKPVQAKFEGSPIFRGKTICITGQFRRGTLEDIISILRSYSANVTTKFDNTVNCVVLGHFENEDTEVTQLASSYGIPIYSEDDFFTSYEIDLDIKKQRDALDHYLK